MFSYWKASGVAPVRVAVVLVLWLAPVTFAWLRAPGFSYRTSLDVYGLALQSPLVLLLPLASALISVSPLFEQLSHQYAQSLAVRVGKQAYVLSHALFSALQSFAVFFFVAFIPFLVIFYCWSALGSPGLTGRVGGVDVTRSATYSQLLALGPLPFGVAYSCVLGLAGGAYAMLTVASLLTFANRYVAILVPSAVSLGGTLAAALVGQPGLGLAYAAVPFGLSQGPIWYALAPLVILLGVSAGWIAALLRPTASTIR